MDAYEHAQTDPMNNARQEELLGQWGNNERLSAISNALSTIPHNQTAIGLGFKLTHAPTNCIRCRAIIALLEISAIVQTPSEVPNVP